MKIRTENSYIFLYTLVYIGLTGYFVYDILGKPLSGTDDANILFEYARNFSHGRGIVYNIGGEHVEGFSCMLYFFICSVFYLFSNTPEIIILSYNIIIAFASSLFILNILKRIAEKNNTPPINLHLLFWIYLFWICINPLYFGWTIVSMMDSGTYSFLLVATYSYLITILLNNKNDKKENRIMSLLIFLIIICRPEGVLWGMVYLLNVFLLIYRQEKKIFPALKKMALPIISYIITIITLTLFRLTYFGFPLPNTYYTKVSASLTSTIKDGMEYFWGFINLYGPLIFIPILLLSILTASIYFTRKEKNIFFYISFITLSFLVIGIAIPILEGGDHFSGFRFYQNIYPLLILPFIFLLFIFNLDKTFGILLINVVVVAGILMYFNNANWTKFINSNSASIPMEDIRVSMIVEFNIAKNSRENGQHLNEIFKTELPIIGYGSAGGIAYAYDGIVYDMMGLNNTKLAHADEIKQGPKGHQSFNKKVFYELAPDILMPTTVENSGPEVLSTANDYYTNIHSWDNLIFKNIFNDTEFKQKYTLASVSNGSYFCYGYFNNLYLRKLSQKNNFTIQTFTN